MKYFIDTEFNAPGAGKPIDLISIGIVDEHGREFYLENRHALTLEVSPWVRDNVFPHLAQSKRTTLASDLRAELLGSSLSGIASSIKTFVGDDPEPEFWGYYCAFDYVVLSQLMGGMDAWPEGWPYYMRDLRQWLDEHGLQTVIQPSDAAHDALEDARWIAGSFQHWCRVKAADIELVQVP